jgi:hypothetical protein
MRAQAVVPSSVVAPGMVSTALGERGAACWCYWSVPGSRAASTVKAVAARVSPPYPSAIVGRDTLPERARAMRLGKAAPL